MGQYYKPVNIDKMQFLYSHDFGSGLKLMEHSYIGNGFVEAVEKLLSPKGAWHKCRFCWAGDYMDDGLFVEEGNLYDMADENVIDGSNSIDDIMNYQAKRLLAEKLMKKWLKTLPEKGVFITNHTKKVCLDVTKEKPFEIYEGEPWTIHPLSLLTCSGNGRGGGDFRGGKGAKRIGTWAGDVISMEHKAKYKIERPISFKEN